MFQWMDEWSEDRKVWGATESRKLLFTLEFFLLNNTTRYCNDDCKVKGEVGGGDDGQEGGDSVGDGEER